MGDGARAGTGGGLEGQHVHQQVPPTRRKLGRDVWGTVEPSASGLGGRTGKGPDGGACLEQDNAEGVGVGGAVDRLALDLLRRQVRRGPDDRSGLRVLHRFPEHVGGFDVAVDHAACVGVVECVGELDADVGHLGGSRGPPRNASASVRPRISSRTRYGRSALVPASSTVTRLMWDRPASVRASCMNRPRSWSSTVSRSTLTATSRSSKRAFHLPPATGEETPACPCCTPP